MYFHKDVVPFTRQQPDQDISYSTLARWISVSYVEFNLKYGQRAEFSIYTQKLSALVYMTDTIEEKIKDDWLADTMVELSYIVREKELGILPIVADQKDKIFHEEDKIDIET